MDDIQITKNLRHMDANSLERICSIIDDLPPDLDFEVSETGKSGLSQGLETHHLFD